MHSIADGMAGMAHGGKKGGLSEHVGQPPEPKEEDGGSPVHEHLAAMHAQMGGKHMHVHHDGMTHTTHHVGEDGQVQGPHDHENIEAVKEHLGKFFNEEEHEDGGYGGKEEKSEHGKGLFG